MIARIAAALAALLLAGCAALAPATPETSAGATPAGPPVVRVQVVVPAADLRALLERYLDLQRLATLPRDEPVSDGEWARLIDATPAQVRDLLQTEGYFRPQVRVTRVSDPSLPEGIVRVEVDPGPRTLIGRVTLDAEGDLQRAAEAGDRAATALLEDLRRAWGLPARRPFRNADWADAKAALLARLRASGYATAAWSGTAADIDAEASQARLFLVADSGPLYRFGSLRVEGLRAHDERTVNNLAGIPAGAPLTETLLLDYQERLQKAGLFDSATVTLDPDPARAAESDVVVRLRESPLQVWTFGVGVSSNTGPRVSVEHLHRRVFGWPAIARNLVEWGQFRQSWNGELATHPLPRQYRWLLGGAVERTEDDDIVLSQRLRLGRAQTTQRIERLAFVEAERSERETPLARTNAVALSANFHGTWRRVDSVILPTRGFTLSLQGGAGQTRESGGATGAFTRAYGRLTWYQPLGSDWYGTARVEAGQVFVRAGLAVPDSQRFRAGGDESVRGYGFRSLGPVVDGVVGSGNALLTGSVELAHPISRSIPSLWGAVFFDTGNAADSFSQLDPVTGIGAGVRWRSPVGPLRLDWAWARELRQGRLHFSVGIAF
jgi:translocation and assembly module TamA